MPNYEYKCSICSEITAHFENPYEDRKHMRECSLCNGMAEYQFPLNAALGFQPFESYHDEGLGVDIHGKRERKQVMTALGLQESGDPVGGERRIESGYLGGIGELTGNRLSVEQYKNEAAVKARDNKMIGVINKDGSETLHRMTDLSTDHHKSVRQGSKSGKGKK